MVAESADGEGVADDEDGGRAPEMGLGRGGVDDGLEGFLGL